MKINTKNTKKIQAELDRVQSRARVRRMAVCQIQDAITRFEKACVKYDIATRSRIGANLFVTTYEKMPSSYRGTAEYTNVRITVGRTGYFMTQCIRTGGDINKSELKDVFWLEEQKLYVADQMMKYEDWA